MRRVRRLEIMLNLEIVMEHKRDLVKELDLALNLTFAA
jgi:hypothetical protein